MISCFFSYMPDWLIKMNIRRLSINLLSLILFKLFSLSMAWSLDQIDISNKTRNKTNCIFFIEPRVLENSGNKYIGE